MLTAAIEENYSVKYLLPHCLLPVKVNRWELCLSQEELLLALVLGTEKYTEE